MTRCGSILAKRNYQGHIFSFSVSCFVLLSSFQRCQLPPSFVFLLFCLFYPSFTLYLFFKHTRHILSSHPSFLSICALWSGPIFISVPFPSLTHFLSVLSPWRWFLHLCVVCDLARGSSHKRHCLLNMLVTPWDAQMIQYIIFLHIHILHQETSTATPTRTNTRVHISRTPQHRKISKGNKITGSIFSNTQSHHAGGVRNMLYVSSVSSPHTRHGGFYRRTFITVCEWCYKK